MNQYQNIKKNIHSHCLEEEIIKKRNMLIMTLFELINQIFKSYFWA